MKKVQEKDLPEYVLDLVCWECEKVVKSAIKVIDDYVSGTPVYLCSDCLKKALKLLGVEE